MVAGSSSAIDGARRSTQDVDVVIVPTAEESEALVDEFVQAITLISMMSSISRERRRSFNVRLDRRIEGHFIFGKGSSLWPQRV
jgi:hypothetical protein